MNPRTERAKQMMQTNGYCSQIDHDKFRVRSQNNPKIFYIVSKTDNGLICECKDHEVRNADCKHIKIALEMMRRNGGHRNNVFRIMERSQLKLCKYCDSGSIKKWGMRKIKNGNSQIYKCSDCKKRFTTNFGFEKKQYDENTITGALQMYFTGMSVRDIANHYSMMGIDISHMTVYRWIDKYSKLTAQYLNGIVPRVGGRFRADEVWIKINGKQCYLFASMDDDTRYWLASDIADNKFQHNTDNLLRMTKRQSGKSPRNFITDGLPAYHKSSKKIFGKKTSHAKHIHLTGKRDRDNNNKMERLNGEMRDREKAFRGLKKMDTAILDGMRIYYNHTKKHGALEGKTPSQVSMIEVDGGNKWKILIQNAALSKDANKA